MADSRLVCIIEFIFRASSNWLAINRELRSTIDYSEVCHRGALLVRGALIGLWTSAVTLCFAIAFAFALTLPFAPSRDPWAPLAFPLASFAFYFIEIIDPPRVTHTPWVVSAHGPRLHCVCITRISGIMLIYFFHRCCRCPYHLYPSCGRVRSFCAWHTLCSY